MKNITKLPEIWPVIHVKTGDYELALRQAEIAQKNGCKGVFLISMDGVDEILCDFAEKIKKSLPKFNVGINHLRLSCVDNYVRNRLFDIGFHWSDHGVVYGDEIPLETYVLSGRVRVSGGKCFQPIGFKYQKKDADIGLSALNTLKLGFIPTTSGAETGKPAPISKLETIRKSIFIGAPLAIASGVTPENIESYFGYVSHILVSTGISEDFYTFSESKLKDLMQRLK